MISDKRVYDLLYLALREIGVAALGDTVDDDVIQEALLVLNAIRAEISLPGKNYTIYDQTFVATGNKPSITLGTGGDIATRPNRITDVILISGDPAVGVNYRLKIRPWEMYREVALPNIYAVPNFAYIDNNYPLQTIYLYPGLTSGWSIRVVGGGYMTEYEHISDPFIDPPEYFSPLYLTLALRMAPKYGVDLPEAVHIQASSAMKHIKAKLFATGLRPTPNGLKTGQGAFNFYAGR